MDAFVHPVSKMMFVSHQQPCSVGSSGHRPLCASHNRWPVPSRSCPPSTRPSPLSQSEPHRQHASESEPSARRRLHQPRGGQPEHAYERAGRACNGGRGGNGAGLAGLAVLRREIRRSAHDRVLQLQPESLSASDEHPLPDVPVSSICRFLL